MEILSKIATIESGLVLLTFKSLKKEVIKKSP